MNIQAVLVECDPGRTLGGSCTRDVNNMRDALVSRCGASRDNVTVVTSDSDTDILGTLRMVKTNENTLTIVLLSGHGYQRAASSGMSVGSNVSSTEVDGMDEYINSRRGIILDDDLFAIVSYWQGRVILLADTCHSGTMFDLAAINWKNCAIFPRIMSVSTCSDSQLSMCDVGEKTGFGGSLTTAVLCDGTLELLIGTLACDVAHALERISTHLQPLGQIMEVGGLE